MGWPNSKISKAIYGYLFHAAFTHYHDATAFCEARKIKVDAYQNYNARLSPRRLCANIDSAPGHTSFAICLLKCVALSSLPFTLEPHGCIVSRADNERSVSTLDAGAQIMLWMVIIGQKIHIARRIFDLRWRGHLMNTAARMLSSPHDDCRIYYNTYIAAFSSPSSYIYWHYDAPGFDVICRSIRFLFDVDSMVSIFISPEFFTI